MATRKPRYWKFLRLKDGKIVSEHDGSEWAIGVQRSVLAPVQECKGLNCSQLITDAMGYVQGEILAEVEISGVQMVGDDKITCEHMTLIRAWKWTKKDSVALSIYAAELVIENFERQYPNDRRPREAIEAAKAWIINPCESTESAARSAESAAWSAESAAWSAAWSAESAAWSARSAAWSAAWSARSAESAAWSAESAAWSAESAARSAESAAWSAAWSAESAAWSAARSAESAAWSAARIKMKIQIQKWIVARLSRMEVPA